MTKGQRTVTGLLAVIAVTLGPSLIVRGSTLAGAQATDKAVSASPLGVVRARA